MSPRCQQVLNRSFEPAQCSVVLPPAEQRQRHADQDHKTHAAPEAKPVDGSGRPEHGSPGADADADTGQTNRHPARQENPPRPGRPRSRGSSPRPRGGMLRRRGAGLSLVPAECWQAATAGCWSVVPPTRRARPTRQSGVARWRSSDESPELPATCDTCSSCVNRAWAAAAPATSTERTTVPSAR